MMQIQCRSLTIIALLTYCYLSSAVLKFWSIVDNLELIFDGPKQKKICWYVNNNIYATSLEVVIL